MYLTEDTVCLKWKGCLSVYCMFRWLMFSNRLKYVSQGSAEVISSLLASVCVSVSSGKGNTGSGNGVLLAFILKHETLQLWIIPAYAAGPWIFCLGSLLFSNTSELELRGGRHTVLCQRAGPDRLWWGATQPHELGWGLCQHGGTAQAAFGSGWDLSRPIMGMAPAESGNHRPSSPLCHQSPPEHGCPAQGIILAQWHRPWLDLAWRGCSSVPGLRRAVWEKHPLETCCGFCPVAGMCSAEQLDPVSASSQPPWHLGDSYLSQAPGVQHRYRLIQQTQQT